MSVSPCSCICCQEFAAAWESVRSLIREHAGHPATGRSLITARDEIETAWAESQNRMRHEWIHDGSRSLLSLPNGSGSAHSLLRRNPRPDPTSEFFTPAPLTSTTQDLDDRDWENFSDDGDRDAKLKSRWCGCDHCTRVRKAAWQVDDLPCMQRNVISAAVANMQKAIWNVRRLLHRLHKPRSYGKIHQLPEQEEPYNDGLAEPDQDDNGPELESIKRWPPTHLARRNVLALPPKEWVEGKYDICSHCMAHGLPCDENAVCEQCQLHNIPCIHRWCEESPNSREDCTQPNCRYTHRDHLPCTNPNLGGVPYIIAPGPLPEYLSRGRKQKGEWNPDFNDWIRLKNDIIKLQKEGRKCIEQQIESKGWNQAISPCSDMCQDTHLTMQHLCS